MKNNHTYTSHWQSVIGNRLRAINSPVLFYFVLALFISTFGKGGKVFAQNTYQLQAASFCPPPPGSGSLAGKTCFDIALGNDNINSCGSLAGRIALQANFTLPTTHTQTYTFTPSGTVSNVRFAYINTNGSVIIAQSGGNSGDNISSPVAGTINFNTNLNTLAAGTTATTALTAEVYAIYNMNATNDNNPANDRSVKLNVQVKDCACCGAMSLTNNVPGAPLVWLSFQCHNLGADISLDPNSYVEGNADGSGGTVGYLFEWGRAADGHELRNSTTTSTLASSTTPGHNQYILNTLGTYQQDWLNGGGSSNRWGDGTTNMNMPKAANDPCPVGWKVPSYAQMASLFTGGNITSSGTPGDATANTWTWTGNGMKIGDNLFLPAAGIRYNPAGSVQATGVQGYYATSTAEGNLYKRLMFQDNYVDYSSNVFRTYGASVRCVAE